MAIGPWWSLVVRGIAAVLFGVLTFIVPGMALLTLVILFGVYAVVEGVFNIAGAVQRRGGGQRVGVPRQPRWALLLEGLVSVAAGTLAFVVPGVTALWLLFLIAAWSLVTGVLEIVTAIRLRRQVKGEWLMALSGVLSIAFGVILMVFPGAGALAVVLWIGAYAVVFGGLLIALGVKLRSWTRGRPGVGFGEFAPSPSR